MKSLGPPVVEQVHRGNYLQHVDCKHEEKVEFDGEVEDVLALIVALLLVVVTVSFVLGLGDRQVTSHKQGSNRQHLSRNNSDKQLVKSLQLSPVDQEKDQAGQNWSCGGKADPLTD